MANIKTKETVSNLSLTTSYQDIDQPQDFGNVGLIGDQVVLNFKRTGGTSITFKIQELFSYKKNGVELIGYVTRNEINGTVLEDVELTCTDTAFQYAFVTLANKIRIQAKGAGGETLDITMSVGEM